MTAPNTQIEGFIFDLDGTVYLGEALLPGALETLQILRKHNKKILFVTNKPLQPRETYAKKLNHLGVEAEPDDIITSGYVLGYHLAKNHPALRLYVIGEPALLNELRGHRLNIIDELISQNPSEVIDPTSIDAVVVAFDRTLDYRKLNTAYQALKNGARFFATNADKTCPMPNGGIPDAGATIAALEHISGRQLELLAGKPSPLIIDVALNRMKLQPQQCIMVGDRLETDMLMGYEAGMKTAVVLTGTSTRKQAEKHTPQVDFILENIGELPRTLQEKGWL